MSHGGGGGGRGEVSSEPNLTPLLDLVLQLVMFFMLVANFVMEDLSNKIKLPVASQAKPLTAKDTNFMYLRRKPPTTTMLDLFGDWPWYILGGELLALVLFAVVMLPFSVTAKQGEKKTAKQENNKTGEQEK